VLCSNVHADGLTQERTSGQPRVQAIRSVRHSANGSADLSGSVRMQSDRVVGHGEPTGPASEYRPPNDLWSGSGSESELNLYQIYNILYGTSIGHADLEGLRVGWETYGPNPEASALSFQAVWHDAHLHQRFGYYTTDGAGNPLYTELFGYGNDIGPSGDIRSYGLEDQIAPPSEPLGFYVSSFLDGSMPVWGSMHSEAMRNYYHDAYDGPLRDYATWPNMEHEVHFLMLQTPDPNVYLLAIEDLPYGHQDSHWDYNDFLVEFRVHTTPIIPEPATITLLGLGLVGCAALKARGTRRGTMARR